MHFKEKREQWLEIAESLKPQLYSSRIIPQTVVRVEADEASFQGWKIVPQSNLDNIYLNEWKRGDHFTLDFGEYLVGYLHLDLAITGMMDAPLRLKLIFGETPAEVTEPFDPYKGDLSRAWLQDETINIDALPQQVRLPRRYAFRYLKIEVIDTSSSFKLKLVDIHCEAVNSANYEIVPALPSGLPEIAKQLDEVALTSLASCMQTVFEDGPKRDRRLWIGDLRLQAITNYISFGNTDLVKRCLYLFAAFAHENGLVAACVFETPKPHQGHCDILDYAALYVSSVLEYAEASNDWETARDLWPVALRQLEGVLEYVNEDGLFIDPGTWWIFIDWQAELHKQTSMHGVIIYCLNSGIELGRKLGFDDQIAPLISAAEKMKEAARQQLFDNESGLFVSGDARQISWASQVWMILAGVVTPQEGAQILQAISKVLDAIRPAGPYLYHYVVDAMLHCGLKEEARSLLSSYWGGMLAEGAKTFWEVYDPQDDFLSPYHSHLVNSYCHAWSCTPAYFIRSYQDLF